MYYSMHIYTNIKNKGFRGLEMKIGFRVVSKAYTNNYLKDIWDVDVTTLNWLKNILVKVKNTTNNLAKSFNSWVEKYMSLQIIMFRRFDWS
jgi:hypothetical protein